MARPKNASPRKRGGAATQAARPTHTLPAWLPAAVVATGGLALLAFQIFAHRTPLYGVETDLLGDFIPAARALRAGHIEVAHFEFKGPGYPLLLAAAGALVGDDWMGARVLNVICTVLGAWFAHRVAARFLGPASGLFVLCGLFLNPPWALAGVEAGTDMPAFALSMAATDLAIRARRPATWGVAGLLAAAAILTRYNAVSLVPAAVMTLFAPRGASQVDAGTQDAPLGARQKFVSLAPYLVGLSLPLAAWALVGQIATGGALHNRNYLNVAFEIYGRGGSWDNFWVDAGQRFHSLIDVLRLDPVRVVKVLGGSAALRWSRDVRQLVPIWLGIPALLGMLLVWPRRRGAFPPTVHFVFAYLVLTMVFYNTRFFLYLVPFYLMGAASLIFEAPGAPQVGPRRRSPLPRSGLRVAVATILLAASGAALLVQARVRFADEPFEVRPAAETLRRLSPHGGRVMARKPHVAYFAGMDLVPMPQVGTFLDLFTAARAARADYLFYSGIEAHLRDQFWLLDNTGITLPGLEKIEARTFTPYRYYTLYRFTSGMTDTAAIVQTLLHQVAGYARAHPTDARAQSDVGGTLLRMGQPAEAIPFLLAAVRLAPDNLQVLGWRARAYFEVGEWQRAAVDCERVIGDN